MPQVQKPAAERDMRGTPKPWRARIVRESRPGSHRATRCPFPRTGARARRRFPPDSVGPALPPKPSRPRAPRHLAGAPPPPPEGAGRTPFLGPGA